MSNEAPDVPQDGAKVAIYCRVSTARQDEAKISMPDQIDACQKYAAQRGWIVETVYSEPAVSGTDENRPVFQKMLDDASTKPKPFDTILVHSFSRYARDAIVLEVTLRRLKKLGVSVISITQDLPDSVAGDLVRRVIGIMDEFFSKENAKHVIRAMKANAVQGFWNGARPPFGYRTVVAEIRGAKQKKVLQIDSEEASVVELIYSLYEGSDGISLGVKAIAARLNRDGITLRGKTFSNSSVHRILSDTIYYGTYHWFKRDSREQTTHQRADWVSCNSPQIIARSRFDQVQATLKARSPRQTPPRVVSGPTLLSGLAICGSCGSGMTISTGKSGRYRYYSCAGRQNRGATVCAGRRYPQAALDAHILNHLGSRLLAPERLSKVLEGFLSRDKKAERDREAKLARLRAEKTKAEGGRRNLFEMVERGVIEGSDEMLREKLTALESRISARAEEIRLLGLAQTQSTSAVTAERISDLSERLRTALASGHSQLRREYLRLFVDKIELDDDAFRITGSKIHLAKAALLRPDQWRGEIVPSFVRKWRALLDSNQRPTA